MNANQQCRNGHHNSRHIKHGLVLAHGLSHWHECEAAFVNVSSVEEPRRRQVNNDLRL
jgi:hypothetical protein